MRRYLPPHYAPAVPRPGTTRGVWLARQRIDDSEGRFNERVMTFKFGPLTAVGGANTTQTIVETVTSLGGRFVRCLGIRGTVFSQVASTGLEMADLQLRIQLNGDNDLIGQPGGTNFATFQTLFSSAQPRRAPPATLEAAPWMTWLSPPYFRAGDLLTVTIVNTSEGEQAATLTPSLSFRLIDDDVWHLLWNRDILARRGEC